MKPSASRVSSTSSRPPALPSSPAGPPRRNVLAAALAVVIGAIISLFPFTAGLLMFLDPVLKRRSAEGGDSTGHGEEGSDKPFLRVASLDSIPADGTPVQVPVLSDLIDAWNREVNQPIGAVYLMRQGNTVRCLNAICPHAGCFVGYSGERKVFQCPCHTSSFLRDGARILPSPSPRDMDPLVVDPDKLKEGEVWVRFMNFYPGKAAPEVKE